MYIHGKKYTEKYTEAPYFIDNVCFSAASPHDFVGTRVNEAIITVLDFHRSLKNKK